MKYIIGLGNPGAEYQHTRHNIGFSMLDAFVEYLGIQQGFNFNKKWNAAVLRTDKFTFIKPMDYMNNSGKVSRAVISFYQKEFKLEDIFVFHDDLDLSLGEFKIQQAKGPKVHNGLLDLNNHLGGNEYWHVRIGIDGRNGDRSIPGSKYVLSNFRPEEKEILIETQQKISVQLKAVIEK
jgi:PTH1 family peptidyl-tRNA hydrolase